MKLRSLAGAVTAVLAIPILGITGAPSAVASPAATIVNIYPGNAAATGWSSEGNQENGGTETFVNGPATPPLGTGSLQLSTPAIADKAFFGNANLAKTPISDLSAMSYSTYVSSAPAGNVALPSYQVPAEANGTTGFTTLVYEPYNQHGASIVNNTWQTWDALNGGNGLWWSTHARGTLLGGPSHLYKWSDIVNALPDATILSIGANLGSHNAGVTASVDAFSVGVSGRTTTYNFELQAPTSLDAAPVVALASAGFFGPAHVGLEAQLLSGTTPVPGAVLTFSAGHQVVCQATTAADGTASCTGLTPLIQAVIGTGYQVDYAGTSLYAPSHAGGRLLVVAGLPLL